MDTLSAVPKIEVLIDEETIQERVKQLGAKIRADYGDESLVFIGVLKGCVPFIADLARAVSGHVEMDYIQVSSWHGQRNSTGIVQFKKDHDIDIQGRNVLIVEDIVDTGLTLAHLRQVLSTRNPKSLRVVSLLNKPEARLHEVPVEYLGFEIPNTFVVGYGLDDGEMYRNIPFVGVVTGD